MKYQATYMKNDQFIWIRTPKKDWPMIDSLQVKECNRPLFDTNYLHIRISIKLINILYMILSTDWPQKTICNYVSLWYTDTRGASYSVTPLWEIWMPGPPCGIWTTYTTTQTSAALEGTIGAKGRPCIGALKLGRWPLRSI